MTNLIITGLILVFCPMILTTSPQGALNILKSFYLIPVAICTVLWDKFIDWLFEGE